MTEWKEEQMEQFPILKKTTGTVSINIYNDEMKLKYQTFLEPIVPGCYGYDRTSELDALKDLRKNLDEFMRRVNDAINELDKIIAEEEANNENNQH